MNVSTVADAAAAVSSLLVAPSPADHATAALFPFLPRWLKLALCVVLVLNARSTPGVWHVIVWWPAIVAQVRAYFVKGVIRQLRDSLAQAGTDPFKRKSVRTLRAGLDDCDFNLHLSNSCYAKHCDASRMKAILDWFGPFLVAGGWCGLAGADYKFTREIKPFSTYDIEFTIGGFGDKFIYIVGTFLGAPDDTSPSESSSATSPVLPDDAEFRASLGRSKDGAAELPPLSPTSTSGAVTPLPRREDGRVVHCVSVSQYCFKLGRLTIPPAIVLAFSGFGAPANADRFEALYTAGQGAMQAWLREGWKKDYYSAGEPVEEFEIVGRRKGRKGDDMRELLAAFAAE